MSQAALASANVSTTIPQQQLPPQPSSQSNMQNVLYMQKRNNLYSGLNHY